MFSFFINLNSYYQALLGGIFTFIITILGASIVFFFKKINKNLMDGLLGLSAGIMIAASYFSLLAPSITMSESLNIKPWIATIIGFTLGGLLLFGGDKVFNKISKTNKSNIMLLSSITLHNIPEGLAIGVAFGSIFYNIPGATLTSALMLTLGIGIQNFPEGSAVSLPLRRNGYSRSKSFFLGALTAIVEPISSLLGAILVMKVRYILPFCLSFAAGAMIYVVVEEIIPESQSNDSKEKMSMFTIFGFILMMFLDMFFS